MSTENVLWMRLLSIADTIDCVSPDNDELLKKVVADLNTFVEIYDRQFDPADDFKEYVITLFSKSMLRLLKQSSV